MSNRLTHLACEVRAAHADMEAALQTSAQRAIDAGRALIEAKELCGHGGWLPWLAEAGVRERTAQRLMKLAASNLESDTVSLLGGVSRALKFIRLREEATRHLRNAYRAAIAIDAGEDADELTPLGWSLHFMDEMVRMFPGHEDRQLVQVTA